MVELALTLNKNKMVLERDIIIRIGLIQIAFKVSGLYWC